jgi:diguanylate cyclase (GGDEF)-like protein/PAS domain S-box-containing protein
VKDALRGAALALAGAAMVELLLGLGLQPYSPLGWPILGMVAAAALYGTSGALGALPVLAAYYAVSAVFPERHAAFFSDWLPTLHWIFGGMFLTGLGFLLGDRLRRAKRLEVELRAARQRLEMALEGSSASLWDADLRNGTVYLSEAWATLVGAPPGPTVTTVKALLDTVPPDDAAAITHASLETAKGARSSYAVEHRVRHSDGAWRWILSRGRVAERDPATGRAVRMIGTNIDITERKKIEESLQREVQYDALTGVGNRTLLEDRLSNAAARTRRSGGRVAVLYLDIDGFKGVNDRLGHGAGDTLLKGFVAQVRGCVREADTVARMGGDEFVVFLENLKDERDATVVADKILAAARAPIAIDEGQVSVTTSIGIAVGEGEWNAEEILRRADKALYEAKAAGRDRARTAA